jgi:hypothetical protein
MDSLKLQIYGIEHEEEVDEIEKKAKEQLAKGLRRAPRKKKVIKNG